MNKIIPFVTTLVFLVFTTSTIFAQKQLRSITVDKKTAAYLYSYKTIARKGKEANTIIPAKGYKLFLQGDGSVLLSSTISLPSISEKNINQLLQFFCDGCEEEKCSIERMPKGVGNIRNMDRYDCAGCFKADGSVEQCKGGFHLNAEAIIGHKLNK